MEPEAPDSPLRCPNCGALLTGTADRCPQCGRSRRPPVVRFDLAEPEPEAPLATLLPAPVWDRLLGAALPFVLSLLWLGGVHLLAAETSLPTASLQAAPVLRFLLPFVALQALRTRYPHLAGGFRNALSLAKQLLSVHLLLLPIALVLLVAGLLNGAFHTTGDCFNRQISYDYQTPLRFAPTAGVAVATLLLQGILAAILPRRITVQAGSIRVARDTSSRVFYGSVAVMLLLALAWWLSFAVIAQGLVVLAALLTAALALARIQKSPELTPRGKMALTALVLLLVFIAIGSAVVSSLSPAGVS